MRSRIPLMWKWSLRDMRERWLQVVGISLIIAFGVALASGLSSNTAWRLESFARSYEQSRAQGVFASLGDEATEELRTAFTVPKQKQSQQQIERTFGKFESLEFVEAWRVNASPNSTIYRFRASFT